MQCSATLGGLSFHPKTLASLASTEQILIYRCRIMLGVVILLTIPRSLLGLGFIAVATLCLLLGLKRF